MLAHRTRKRWLGDEDRALLPCEGQELDNGDLGDLPYPLSTMEDTVKQYCL